jgi:hypothetical protein
MSSTGWVLPPVTISNPEPETIPEQPALNTVALHQFLVLYTWFPLAALLLLMLLIGRFYQKFSGEQTYFWLYIPVTGLFGAAAVRYAGAGIVLGDALSDVLMAIAGMLLLFLSGVLYRHMMNRSAS